MSSIGNNRGVSPQGKNNVFFVKLRRVVMLLCVCVCVCMCVCICLCVCVKVSVMWSTGNNCGHGIQHEKNYIIASCSHAAVCMCVCACVCICVRVCVYVSERDVVCRQHLWPQHSTPKQLYYCIA